MIKKCKASRLATYGLGPTDVGHTDVTTERDGLSLGSLLRGDKGNINERMRRY